MEGLFKMKKNMSIGRIVFLIGVMLALMPGARFTATAADTNSYQNFDVAVFVELADMRHMASDPKWMEESWNLISHYLKVDKVWLETYRDGQLTPEADVRKVKEFFTSKGIKVSGGLMCTRPGRPGDRLTGFDYGNPADREQFRKVVAYTAGLFDEILFDDLFIFNSRSDFDQQAKGDLSWTDYRLKVMKEVGEDLVVKNAKSVNPKVNLIIKPPNWYEQYQFCGYNLEAQSKAFDMIYCGTETRDPDNTVMHLQQYQSYDIMRYYEHTKPGKFGGGWVDPGARQTLNRYTEQLEDTLFAKPREITLWCYGNALETLRAADGTTNITSILYADAGDTFAKLDSFLGKLGQPYGVASYKPFCVVGRDVPAQFRRDDRRADGFVSVFPGRARDRFPHGIRQVRSGPRQQNLEAPERGQDGRHHLRPFEGAAREGHREDRGSGGHGPEGAGEPVHVPAVHGRGAGERV